MRIAFITPEYVTEANFDGGLANYLRRVSTALKDFGHEPVVFVAADRDEQFDHEGIMVVRVNVRGKIPVALGIFRKGGVFRSLSWLWQSWMLNKALQSFHRRQPVIVAQFASYMATAFFRPRSIPAVVRISSLQSLLDKAYDNRLTVYTRLAQYLEAAAIKKADRLIGPGKKVAEHVTRLTGKKVGLVESPYIPFRGKLDEHPYKAFLAGKRYLLFFGSIGVLKGVKTLGDIMYGLLEKHPDLFFVFAGKDMGYGGGAMMDYVRAQAGSLSCRVICLGVLPQGQLLPIVEHACAVVLPSRIDNFPNTCLEAMACGQIVVGTRGTSFEQLIEDGISGFLCNVDDGRSLMQAIEAALSMSEDEKRLMAGRARQRIDMLQPAVTVAGLVDIYREVACR